MSLPLALILVGVVAGVIGALVEHFLPEIKTATREIAGHDVALGNPVPKPIADALARQWRHFDQTAAILPYARPPNLVLHELEQAPQQKPLARLK